MGMHKGSQRESGTIKSKLNSQMHDGYGDDQPNLDDFQMDEANM